jgi:hypothetical protein
LDHRPIRASIPNDVQAAERAVVITVHTRRVTRLTLATDIIL